MKFVLDDGGRAEAGFKGRTGDCVCRAIAIATSKPYKDVYNELRMLIMHNKKVWNKASKSFKNSSPRTGIPRKIYDSYLKQLGWTWVPTMGIGTGCKIHLRAEELPEGVIICRISKHMTAVIDGVIHDTFNPSREMYWSQFKNGTETKGVYGRCVYGYYMKSG